MPNIGLSQVEVKSTIIIFLIYMFRMLGIFMIFPILSIFLSDYEGATPFLIGIALGIWGLTNAIFQIPLGILSDVIGRKKVILLGLTIFLIGSLVAANANDITNVILGRTLQGIGAIAGTLMALISDVSSEKNRTMIMAFIGIGIGFSFFISFLIGPIIGHAFQLSGVFLAAAIFSFISVILIMFFPDKDDAQLSQRFQFTQIKTLFNNKEIVNHFAGIFILHLILTACFIAIPITLTNIHDIDSKEYPQVFSFVLSMALIMIIPMLIFERKKPEQARLFSTFLLLCSLVIMTIFYSSPIYTILALIIFMGSFSVIEASLPSSTSKIVPNHSRGSSMGFFSTFQFLGTFAGGVVGGFVLGSSSLSVIFLVCAIIAGIWFMTSFVQMSYR